MLLRAVTMEMRWMYCLQNADLPEKISQSSNRNVLDPVYNAAAFVLLNFT